MQVQIFFGRDPASPSSSVLFSWWAWENQQELNMFKNTASQKVTVLAIDTAANLPKTGDAANITLYYNGDDGGVTVMSTNSGHPTEDDATNSPGTYSIAMTQSETNFNKIVVSGKSGTANIRIVPLTFQTLPSAVGIAAGAAGGLFIAGTNASLTVTGATVLTGNVSMAAGLTITQSSANTPAVNITGTGTGAGLKVTGGATGHGFQVSGGVTGGDGMSITGSTNGGNGITATGNQHGIKGVGGNGGDGIQGQGDTAGAGIRGIGGSSGPGMYVSGGGVSGSGFKATALTSGHGIEVVATGTSKHGLFVTGGTAGVSDGVKAVAGTGGVDIRGNITGNLTGTAQVDVAQVIPTSNSANTLGDCLNAARAQGFGKWVLSGTTLTLYAADGTTVVRTFTLDSATAPTQRV